MKFNTDTYYESQLLFTKLKRLPKVNEILVNNDKLLLISKRNNKIIEIVQAINIDVIVIDDLTYIRLDDILSLLSLSSKTRKNNEDEMHLIGNEDEIPELVSDV